MKVRETDLFAPVKLIRVWPYVTLNVCVGLFNLGVIIKYWGEWTILLNLAVVIFIAWLIVDMIRDHKKHCRVMASLEEDRRIALADTYKLFESTVTRYGYDEARSRFEKIYGVRSVNTLLGPKPTDSSY